MEPVPLHLTTPLNANRRRAEQERDEALAKSMLPSMSPDRHLSGGGYGAVPRQGEEERVSNEGGALRRGEAAGRNGEWETASRATPRSAGKDYAGERMRAAAVRMLSKRRNKAAISMCLSAWSSMSAHALDSSSVGRQMLPRVKAGGALRALVAGWRAAAAGSAWKERCAGLCASSRASESRGLLLRSVGAWCKLCSSRRRALGNLTSRASRETAKWAVCSWRVEAERGRRLGMLVKRVVEARARHAVWAWRLATREGRAAGNERTVDEDTYREVRLVSHVKMLAESLPFREQNCTC